MELSACRGKASSPKRPREVCPDYGDEGRAPDPHVAVSLFLRTAKSKDAVQSQAETNQRAVAEVEQKKKEAANLRDVADTRLQAFSSDFADIIQAVMGATVEAKISITGDGLVPHVTRKGELSGAALDTIASGGLKITKNGRFESRYSSGRFSSPTSTQSIYFCLGRFSSRRDCILRRG